MQIAEFLAVINGIFSVFTNFLGVGVLDISCKRKVRLLLYHGLGKSAIIYQLFEQCRHFLIAILGEIGISGLELGDCHSDISGLESLNNSGLDTVIFSLRLARLGLGICGLLVKQFNLMSDKLDRKSVV